MTPQGPTELSLPSEEAPSGVEYPTTGAGAQRALWLACEIEWADGRVSRFGHDEASEGDIPLGISFATQNPGGDADGSVILNRPPWIRAEDAPLFAAGRFYGPANRTRYSGRVKGVPQVGVSEIRIDFEGWATALDDNEFFRFLGVHNNLSEWEGPSLTRENNLIAGGYQPKDDGGVEQDTTGLSALVSRLTTPWSVTVIAEKTLRLDGQNIGAMVGTWKKNANNDAGAAWDWRAGLASDDTLASRQDTGNIKGAGPATFFIAATAPREVAFLDLIHTGTASSSGLPHDVQWTVLSVFGTHGLPAYLITGGVYGLHVSDIIRYAVQSGASGIAVNPDSVEDVPVIIPHIVHEGTVRELVEAMNAFGGAAGELNDWGVYDREFFWKTPGTHGRTWRVRRDQVATPTDEGPTSEERCAGVVIVYEDGAGQRFSVGPPNTDASFTTTELQDISAHNSSAPANRIKKKDIGIGYRELAIQVGKAILAEQNADKRRGSVVIQGTATDDTGTTHPANAIRACDRVVIEDDRYAETLPVNSTSFSQDDLSLVASLGATPHAVEVLLAQLQAGTPT